MPSPGKCEECGASIEIADYGRRRKYCSRCLGRRRREREAARAGQKPRKFQEGDPGVHRYDPSVHSRPEYGVLDCYVTFARGWEKSLLEMQDGTCAFGGCSVKRNLTPILLKPLHEGGANALWNALLVCEEHKV